MHGIQTLVNMHTFVLLGLYPIHISQILKPGGGGGALSNAWESKHWSTCVNLNKI